MADSARVFFTVDLLWEPIRGNVELRCFPTSSKTCFLLFPIVQRKLRNVMLKFNPEKDVVIAIKDGIVWNSYLPPNLTLTVVDEDEEEEEVWDEALQFIEENSND